MYCPLCKAEYREGFLRCSDCKIDLVQTYEEAQAIKVMLLWEGVSLSKFCGVVAALDDAKIPNHAESGASLNSSSPWWSRSGVFAIFRLFVRIGGASPTMGWKVVIFESHYVAAKAIVQRILS